MNVGRCFLCLGATKWAGWTRKLPCWTHVGQWLDTCWTEVLASNNCLVGRMLDIVRARVGQRLLFRCLVAVILDTSVINVIPKRAAKQMLTLTSHLAKHIAQTLELLGGELAQAQLFGQHARCNGQKPVRLSVRPPVGRMLDIVRAHVGQRLLFRCLVTIHHPTHPSSQSALHPAPTPHHHSAIHTSTCPPACFITQCMGGSNRNLYFAPV